MVVIFLIFSWKTIFELFGPLFIIFLISIKLFAFSFTLFVRINDVFRLPPRSKRFFILFVILMMGWRMMRRRSAKVRRTGNKRKNCNCNSNSWNWAKNKWEFSKTILHTCHFVLKMGKTAIETFILILHNFNRLVLSKMLLISIFLMMIKHRSLYLRVYLLVHFLL